MKKKDSIKSRIQEKIKSKENKDTEMINSRGVKGNENELKNSQFVNIKRKEENDSKPKEILTKTDRKEIKKNLFQYSSNLVYKHEKQFEWQEFVKRKYFITDNGQSFDGEKEIKRRSFAEVTMRRRNNHKRMGSPNWEGRMSMEFIENDIQSNKKIGNFIFGEELHEGKERVATDDVYCNFRHTINEDKLKEFRGAFAKESKEKADAGDIFEKGFDERKAHGVKKEQLLKEKAEDEFCKEQMVEGSPAEETHKFVVKKSLTLSPSEQVNMLSNWDEKYCNGKERDTCEMFSSLEIKSKTKKDKHMIAENRWSICESECSTVLHNDAFCGEDEKDEDQKIKSRINLSNSKHASNLKVTNDQEKEMPVTDQTENNKIETMKIHDDEDNEILSKQITNDLNDCVSFDNFETSKEPTKKMETKKYNMQLIQKSVDGQEVIDEDNVAFNENKDKVCKRKESFFTSIMAKKEEKIAGKVAFQNQLYEVAMNEIEKAKTRYRESKSLLPLMIVEQRVPKTELLDRLKFKLEDVEKRLEAYEIFIRKTNCYIQQWRTIDGKIENKKLMVTQFRRKTSEKQKMLLFCKKKEARLYGKIIQHEDRQLQANRRIKSLIDRIEMLKLRQKEKRNIVNRRIKAAKINCEASIREAAKVVLASKKVQQQKEKQKELEDKNFQTKQNLKKMKTSTKEKKFDLERVIVQKSVKAMKKERGW